jgi:hypothetical protein
MSEPPHSDARSFDVLSAYRRDLPRISPGEPSERLEAHGIVIGTMLEHAARARATERSAMLARVRDKLREALGADAWHRGPQLDPDRPADDTVLAPRVRLLCEEIEDAGAVHFADAVLSAYLASRDDISDLERGRCSALRARLAWKRGEQELAAEHYERVSEQADRIDSDELAARAAIGRAILARLRGNLPASRQHSATAVQLAEGCGFTRLAGLGHQMLMIAAIKAGETDAALSYAWRAYAGVEGDAEAEGERLVDLGQLFYDSGHPAVAAAAFAAALQRPLPDRILLPALGGAALAAARGHDDLRLKRCAERALRLGRASALPYAAAASWLEGAATLASEHAFHELAYRADRLRAARSDEPAPARELSQESWEIAHAVQALAGAGT